jgi:hypothetical protein
MRGAWTEGNPRGPAECRKAGVGSAIVVGHHNRCSERDEDEDVHRRPYTHRHVPSRDGQGKTRCTYYCSNSEIQNYPLGKRIVMSTGQLGRILRQVPALAPCSSWTMFVAPSRCLTATPYVQTCHVTSSSGHRGLPSACGRARFSSSAGKAGGSVETEEDLYSILQVPRDADQREIKQAFYQSEHRCAVRPMPCCQLWSRSTESSGPSVCQPFPAALGKVPQTAPASLSVGRRKRCKRLHQFARVTRHCLSLVSCV